MFKKRHIETEAKNSSDAIDHIFIGVKWFLVHHFKKTVIILMLLFGGVVYCVMDYVQMQLRHKSRIEQLIKGDVK